VFEVAPVRSRRPLLRAPLRLAQVSSRKGSAGRPPRRRVKKRAAATGCGRRDGRPRRARAGGICSVVGVRVLRRQVVRACRLSGRLRLWLSRCAPFRRLAHKGRILWGLRKMPTAPGSLGIPFLGHTFALARGVTRYPCTWDLFSIWSRATAPVRLRGRGPRCTDPLRPRRRAGARACADIHGAVRRHRRPCADEARAADQPEELWQGPGVLVLAVHRASQRGRGLRRGAPHAPSLSTCTGHLGHRAGH
jgi:hypothetical protein